MNIAEVKGTKRLLGGQKGGEWEELYVEEWRGRSGHLDFKLLIGDVMRRRDCDRGGVVDRGMVRGKHHESS